MKKFLITAVVVAFALGAFETVKAQKVRLRGAVTPTCSSGTSIWKFADIFADGNIAVQGSYNCRGAFIYNVSNPDSPTLANWYNPGNNQQFLEAIVVGNRGYFGSGNGGGVHIVDLTNPSSPALLGIVNGSNGTGFSSIHEMMVIQQDGATYLLENFNGTGTRNLKIINVTNPAAAVLKWDFLPTDPTWIHAMHIRGNRMYLSGWGGKVDIYNIANLATQTPQLLGSISVGAGNNHSSWTDESGNYLYSCRELLDGDVRVYDVHDPTQPVLVRSIKAGDLSLNAITPHNPVVRGNRLYVAWYQAGLQVFDISNPANPVRIGQYDTFQPQFAPPEEEFRVLRESDPWDLVCGNSEGLQASLPNSYNGDWAVYPFLGEDRVLAGDLTSGLLVLDASHVAQNVKNTVSDFDGDQRTDFSVFTPTTGDWTIEYSSDSTGNVTNWGLAGDIITPGDYDGDGKSDRAIFRPTTGTWWFIMSSNGSRPAVQFGLNGDIPVPADYDADGRTDVAVFRPSNGVWYINQSTLGIRYQQWGASTDKVFAGDFEGDGKADLVAWRPSTGVWYILQSSSSIPLYYTFGTNGDKPLVADFDGDGEDDYSVYRPSTGVWYMIKSLDNSFSAYQFGIAEDFPIPADYDGDGKTDITVFRPSTNVWYRVNSAGGAFSIREFGQNGDTPSPRSVQPQ